MSSVRSDLPTLTEVVELARKPGDPPGPLPPQGESVALEPGIDAPPEFAPTQLDPSAVAPLAEDPAPMPLHAEAAPERLPPLAYDEELIAQVMVRLQPRLEAWVEGQVRHALMDMLPVWTESAALTVVRELRTQMPELLSVALDEVHRQREGG